MLVGYWGKLRLAKGDNSKRASMGDLLLGIVGLLAVTPTMIR
jgi:hypothetical protein